MILFVLRIDQDYDLLVLVVPSLNIRVYFSNNHIEQLYVLIVGPDALDNFPVEVLFSYNENPVEKVLTKLPRKYLILILVAFGPDELLAQVGVE